MAEYGSSKGLYTWQECEDFLIPENCVWFGNDENGSDIFCGKAWYEGQEVPAKVIPEKRQSIVACDDGEKVVPNCRKVLICETARRRDCFAGRDHCRRRRRHCHRRDDCCSSSSSDEDERSSHTKTISSSKNESRMLVKSVRSTSNTTTTSVKKDHKKHHHKRCPDERSCKQECWNEQRTRIVPKITYEPKVRYEPKVTMERRVRYEPETYVTRVCSERCYDWCEDRCKPCDPCVEPWRPERRCREEVVCERSTRKCDVDKVESCVRPERSDSPPPSKGKCW